MKYGFIFPGQGSQSTTMLAAYGEHPVVANAVHEASESLGMDLAAIIADDTAINRTENTQPAMLAVCVGVYRAVVRPAYRQRCLPDIVWGNIRLWFVPPLWILRKR